MKSFETIGSDGRIYLHYENWERWRNDRLSEYPCPSNQYRFDIELITPRDRLEDVPVERNPHGFSHPPAHEPHFCYYKCDDWSTIWGVHDAHKHDVEGPSLRMLVESGCPEPIWGERIQLMSTSNAIQDEPWGMNVANKFAYFRGQYWRVIMWQFLHDFEWYMRFLYPLRNRTNEFFNPRRRLHLGLWEWGVTHYYYYYPKVEYQKYEIDWRKEGF